jgi:hypothetical protein
MLYKIDVRALISEISIDIVVSGGNLKPDYLYFFKNARLGAIYKTQAPNSDLALMKCLRETNWDIAQLTYEGKDTLPKELENRFWPPNPMSGN